MIENLEQLKKIIEGALMAAGEPLTIERLLSLFDEAERPTPETIQSVLVSLQDDYAMHGIELKEIASGFCFQVKAELSQWIRKLWEERPPRYSRALLETLALIAYRQPITRAEIEEVRGVAVSSTIIKTLQERNWIRVVGHRDVPGKPGLYATTKQFLDYFNLKSLDELPTLNELQEIDFDQLDAQLQNQLQAEAEAANHEEAEQAITIPASENTTANETTA